MTREHLGICVALNLPFFVVVTKVDICPENIMKETMANLSKILKNPQVKRVPIPISEKHSEKDMNTLADQLYSERVCPIFTVSSVVGTGLP